MKYRKKPIVIEAFRLGIDCIPDWCMKKAVDREMIGGKDVNKED